jgi:predicted PurR-regulated permease PerM
MAFTQTAGEPAAFADGMRNEPEPGVLTWGVIIIVTCLILYLFERVLWLVVPGLLALVGYYCLHPLVQALVRAGLKHRTAGKVVAGLLFLAMVLGLILLLSLATTRAAGWQAVTAHYVQGGLDFLGKTEGLLAKKLPLVNRSALVRSTPTNLDAAAEQFVDNYLGGLLLQMLHWLPSLLLVPYLTYFMLQDGNRFKKHVIRSVPNAFFEKTLLLFDRVDRSLQSYLVGLVKLTCLDTACLGLGLCLLGISHPVLLGLIAAVLAWVPYLGSVAGGVLVTMVAATDYPNEPVTIYGCVVLFICVRLLDDFVFLPATVGRSLRFHPVLSVLMLFLGAAVAGPAGLLLVLPVLGVVAVVTETLRQILTDERLRTRYRHARQLQRTMAEVG